MSDLENLDVMSENYSRNEVESHQGDREIELKLESNGLRHNANSISRDIWSISNTNGGEKSVTTAETARAINCKITSQVTRPLDEIEID